MSRFRFLHAADLHLGSHLTGLGRYESDSTLKKIQDEIHDAPKQALENLITLALEQQVSFVILAGDIYDGKWDDVQIGLFMVDALSRLTKAGIQVIMLSGNHDAASKIPNHLRFPEGVTHLPSQKPSTVRLDDLGVALHGQSFAKQHVTDNLARTYPEPIEGWFNIGVLHTSLAENTQEPYAPCSFDDLISKGYDYWALGHVHSPQILREKPHIVYPGVLQGRHIREIDAHGVMIVEVDDQQIQSVTPVACDIVRWAAINVDMRDIDHIDALCDRVTAHLKDAYEQTGDRPLIVRLSLTGATTLHDRLCSSFDWHETIQSLISHITINGRFLTLEKIENRTTPPPRLMSRTGQATLDQAIEEALDDADFRAAASDDLAKLLNKIPPDIHRNMTHIKNDIETFETVHAALKHRLIGGEN